MRRQGKRVKCPFGLSHFESKTHLNTASAAFKMKWLNRGLRLLSIGLRPFNGSRRQFQAAKRRFNLLTISFFIVRSALRFSVSGHPSSLSPSSPSSPLFGRRLCRRYAAIVIGLDSSGVPLRFTPACNLSPLWGFRRQRGRSPAVQLNTLNQLNSLNLLFSWRRSRLAALIRDCVLLVVVV